MLVQAKPKAKTPMLVLGSMEAYQIQAGMPMARFTSGPLTETTKALNGVSGSARNSVRPTNP